MPLSTRLAISNLVCDGWRIAYRIADSLGLPTEPVRVRYVRAVRHSNALYWWRYAVSIGDTAYTDRYPKP